MLIEEPGALKRGASGASSNTYSHSEAERLETLCCMTVSYYFTKAKSE